MLKKVFAFLSVLLIAVALVTSVLPQGANAQGESKIYMPLVLRVRDGSQPTPTPEPDVCHDPKAKSEQHSPDGDWEPKPGTERIINVWFPGGGTYEQEHKLRLTANQDVTLINGGGTVWFWDAGCGAIADENFAANALPEVTLQQLIDTSLAYEGDPPPACTDNTPETHEPSGDWHLPPGTERIINLWIPGGGQYEAEHKLRLTANQDVTLINGGGTVWFWDAGCGTTADENFSQNPLLAVTLQQLVDAGLATTP